MLLAIKFLNKKVPEITLLQIRLLDKFGSQKNIPRYKWFTENFLKNIWVKFFHEIAERSVAISE
jgi:hypothetical protein